MSKNEKYMNSAKENKEVENKDIMLNVEQPKVEQPTEKVTENKSKQENKNTVTEQEYKVYSIVNEKAVMAKGIIDGKWYSKPNKNYKIGQIIKD